MQHSTVAPKSRTLSALLWRDVVLRRALSDAFGYAAIPAVALIGVSLLSRRYVYAVLAAVAAFLVPFLVFTNLHIVHFYYQTANAILIVAAAGLALASLIRMSRNWLGLLGLAVLVAGQLVYFRSVYAIYLTHDFSGEQLFRIAKLARTQTELGASLIVIGDDWSSTIPYYAERKSLDIPNWLALPSLQRIVAAPQKYLDDARLGGVVYCADKAPTDPDRKTLIDAFLAGRAVLGEVGPCRLLAPDKR